MDDGSDPAQALLRRGSESALPRHQLLHPVAATGKPLRMSSPLPLPATSPIEVTSGKLQRRKKRSRKDAAMQVRESGWATTSVSMSRSWNSYNAFEDPHCPWALALKHNLHGSRRSAALLNGKTVGDAKIKADHGVKETILSMTEPLTLDRWSLPTMPKTQKKSDIGSREGRQNTASGL